MKKRSFNKLEIVTIIMIFLLNISMLFYFHTKDPVPYGADIGAYILGAKNIIDDDSNLNLNKKGIVMQFPDKSLTHYDYIPIYLLLAIISMTTGMDYISLSLVYMLSASTLLLISLIVFARNISNHVAILSSFFLILMYSYMTLVNGLFKNLFGLAIVILMFHTFMKKENHYPDRLIFLLLGIFLMFFYGYLVSFVIFVSLFSILTEDIKKGITSTKEYLFLFIFTEVILLISRFSGRHIITSIALESSTALILSVPLAYLLIYGYVKALVTLKKNIRYILYTSSVILIFSTAFFAKDIVSFLKVPFDYTIGRMTLLTLPVYFQPVVLIFSLFFIGFIYRKRSAISSQLMLILLGWILYVMYVSFFAVNLGIPIERFIFLLSIPVSIITAIGFIEFIILYNHNQPFFLKMMLNALLSFAMTLISILVLVPEALDIPALLSDLTGSHNVLQFRSSLMPFVLIFMIAYISILISYLIYLKKGMISTHKTIIPRNSIYFIILIIFLLSISIQIVYISTRTGYLDNKELSMVTWIDKNIVQDDSLFTTRGVGTDTYIMHMTGHYVESQYTPIVLRDNIMMSEDSSQFLRFMDSKELRYIIVTEPFISEWDISKFDRYPFDRIYDNNKSYIVRKCDDCYV